MRTLRNLALFLISLIGYQNLQACGGWEDYDTYFRLFNPGYMLPDNQFGPITYSDEPWSNINSWFTFEAQHEDNITCWKKHFPVSFSSKSIQDFIYTIEVEQLEAAREGHGNSSNQVLNWVKKNDPETLTYLLFARSCENHCNIEPYYYWEEKEEKDVPSMNQLIETGTKQYKQCTNAFLKQRYGFQLVKLMRYAGQYDQCLNFWKQELQTSKNKNLIWYWTLDHIAGVQLLLGNQTEGWKNFITVFQNCPSKRYSSYYSIKIDSDEAWNNLYNACETTGQKETMHFIRGSHLGSIALSDVKAIYELNPKSAYLPALISREINKMESILLQNDPDDNAYYQLYYNQNVINEEIMTYAEDFRQFLSQAITDTKINKPDFWKISAAYLSFLTQKPDNSYALLGTLSNNLSAGFTNQISILKNVLLLTNKNKNALARQNELKEIWNVEVKDFAYFFFQHPSNKLPFPLASGKRMYNLRTQLDTKSLEALVDLTENHTQLTWFANYMLEDHFLPKANSQEQAYNLDYLNEMLGTSYLADEETEKAIEAFSRLSESFKAQNEDFYLDYNPFNSVMNDRDRSSLNAKPYSKLKFAKTLHTIEQVVDAGNPTAMDLFLLGNAFYNSTYFGFAWDAKAYYHSGSYYTGVFDCYMARSYYTEAAQVAEDREMQAKCYYMAAKANQNLYYTDKVSGKEYYWIQPDNQDSIAAKGNRAEFEILQNNYQGTEFYNDLIEECKYFDFYIN
ncbi:hypothetical protein DMA11_03560 [Marinilabiliaceae bacterium JC017]|nr:hypothetical protein DMA11_03560 [Marinilabiliaceae bacterium JC017]